MIKKGYKRGTIIHGIGSSSHLDSSGERIKIEGVDISSLTSDGVANWEHKSGEASQIVGKIIEAKKILKESDCENDHHKYFWNKVKTPYIYIAIELFDAEGHEGAKSVAAMVKYDKKTDKRKTKRLINFSIEGSRLKKDGANILKCIARKISITIHPCNKTCEAEEMKEEVKKNLLQEVLNKKEDSYCEIMKAQPKKYYTSLYQPKQKQISEKQAYVPKPKGSVGDESRPGSLIKPKRSFSPGQEPKNMMVGDRIAYQNKQPRSGRDIYNDPETWKSEDKEKKQIKVSPKKMVEEHKKLVDVLESPSHKDDKKEAKKQKKEMKEYKKKMEKKQGVPKGANPEVHERCVRHLKDQGKDKSSAFAICNAAKAGMKKGSKKIDKKFYDSNVKKALTAGSGMSAPAQKEGGQALSEKTVNKEMMKVVCKSISEDNWNTFNKKEELINFLSSRLDKLNKKEILALAKTVAYYRTKKEELKLIKMIEKDIKKRHR